jgi:predicted  nucleic acid-binding Zn-ribbon protein
MFKCARCGSRYSAAHAAALENCPRCQIRDRVAAPLAFKVFRLPLDGETPESPRLENEDAEVVADRSLGPV